ENSCSGSAHSTFVSVEFPIDAGAAPGSSKRRGLGPVFTVLPVRIFGGCSGRLWQPGEWTGIHLLRQITRAMPEAWHVFFGHLRKRNLPVWWIRVCAFRDYGAHGRR